jgi:putative glutamine amidotransferase
LEHEAELAPGSRLAELNGSEHARINTSHHQAIDRPGKDLRVTAQAGDGVVEGVEWQGEGPWVVGVQWHPERMAGDRFSERLFEEFVAAVRSARGAVAHPR